MRPTLLAPLVVSLALLAPVASAQTGEDPLDRSQSPYFVVKGAEQGVETMPLASTRADIDVSGLIAHVKVTQVYKNEGTKPLEAIYVFPGSTRAAVFAMRMTIGERVIVAEIQKKEDARKMYEDAKQQGKTASLLEQQRPNVFQMSVANIMPGDTIKVEMDYSEALVPTDGLYELVYPAVVGPRYTGESTSGETWTAQPTTKEGVKPSYAYDIAVHINGGMPITRVMSSTHPIQTTFDNPNEVSVALAQKSSAGTKDFVLQYKLAGAQAQSGLLLFPGEKENFFLAMVQPPERVDRADRPKREYIFIVDTSGSMWGFPIDTAKKLMNELLDGMNENDKFNILCFSGGNLVMSPQSLDVTPDNVKKAKAFMAGMQGGGGTEILGALREALAMRTPGDYARTFVAVTDGYVSVEPQVFQTIRENLGKASFFAFGIGSSVNRYIIEGMARSGMGEPFIVMHDDDAVEKGAKLEKYIENPALTQIKVKFDGFDAYDVEPMQVPDLFASRPVMVFGKYRGAPKGNIVVTGVSGKGEFKQTLAVQSYKADKRNEALRYLWARHRIATLSDYQTIDANDKNVADITQLGLDYNLMTNYTSFIAIDNRVRNTSGQVETVKQPLPLPEGVSNNAVAQAPMAVMPAPRSYGGYGGGRAVKSEAVELDVQGSPSRADDELEYKPADAPEKPKPVLTTPKAKMQHVTATVRDVQGGRDAASLQRAVNNAVTSYLRCLEGTSIATPERVTLKVSIDASGKITVQVVTGGGTPSSVSGCFRSTTQRVTLGAGPATTFLVDLDLRP